MVKQLKSKQFRKIIILMILILIGSFSNLFLSKILSSPERYAATIESLDEKRDAVLKLSVAAAASATAISAIPGDATTPIANQIAGLTPYFIAIMAAITLEKMLIGVVATITFKYLIPVSCFLWMIYVFYKNEMLLVLGFKLMVFGIILYAAIPISIQISDMLYDQYNYQASINHTIATAEQNKEYIEVKKNELSAEDQNWIGKVGGYISNLTSKISSELSAMVKKGEDSLTLLMDAIAVLIITSCVIPLAVILFFSWVIRIIFGFDVKRLLPKISKIEKELDIID